MAFSLTRKPKNKNTMNSKLLYSKQYKFEELPSLRGWNLHPDESADIHSALDDYAKSVIRIAMREVKAYFVLNGIEVEFSDDTMTGIEISYSDCITAMVESAQEYDQYDGDPYQSSLNCKIEELEDALKILKSLKK
jgi:hypothetical protein